MYLSSMSLGNAILRDGKRISFAGDREEDES
jgi:hypothetical protein